MKKPIAAGITCLALVGTTFLGAGSAHAGDNNTYIPGGDDLYSYMETTTNWSGDPSCENLESDVLLLGSNPSVAQSIVNKSYVNAYGDYSAWLTWLGEAGHGTVAAHVAVSTTQGYDWKASLIGNVCIGTGVVYIDGEVEGSAYIPQEGGWHDSDASLD